LIEVLEKLVPRGMTYKSCMDKTVESIKNEKYQKSDKYLNKLKEKCAKLTK